MNVKSTVRINELLDRVTKLCKIEDALLVFKTDSTENHKLYHDKVHVDHFQHNNLGEEKVAYVSDIAGTLIMQLEREKV